MSSILTDTLTRDQRATERRPVEHPTWCDPRHCATDAPFDGEALVTHRAVLLDEPRDGLPSGGRLAVEVVRGDVVCVHGGELLAQDAAAVRVRGVDALTEIAPEQAGRLAWAVAAAAELAGGAR